eukprot:1183057-Prorocentrum_minimum.AAC.5
MEPLPRQGTSSTIADGSQMRRSAHVRRLDLFLGRKLFGSFKFCREWVPLGNLVRQRVTQAL